MLHLCVCFALAAVLAVVSACSNHDPEKTKIANERRKELERKWSNDFSYSGVSTYAHLPYIRCLTHPEELFDIAVIGAPFDTSVSYRPGARYGPRAIRIGSSQQTLYRSYNAQAGINPFKSWARVLDCGDIPLSPFDNALAERQMHEAFLELGSRPPATPAVWKKPFLLTLGGDHSVALPALRALKEVVGRPVAVIHFDAHLDTWDPEKYPSTWPSKQAHFNHGSPFWLAGRQGLVTNSSNVHAGIRCRLSGIDDADYQDAGPESAYLRIEADEIDDLGADGVAAKIRERVGENPVYLSLDIDVLDPGFAPGTGTPEPGGWTPRELLRILRRLEGLDVVGADIVEVSPLFDGPGEETAVTAAKAAFEILSNVVKKGKRKAEESSSARDEL